MKMTTIGLDLAKNIFQVHGVDEQGQVVLKKSLKRTKVLPFFANLEPCRIGMEACGGAHYWARQAARFGHTVRLMAPQFVKPYVKTNKNDAADAEAICEAVDPAERCGSCRSSPLSSRAVLALHRARQGFVKARTAQANQIRGLLDGVRASMIPQGIGAARQTPVRWCWRTAKTRCRRSVRALLQRLGEHLKEPRIVRWRRLEEQIAAMASARTRPPAANLAAIPGIGPLTCERAWWPRWAMLEELRKWAAAGGLARDWFLASSIPAAASPRVAGH
jgi:transposase